jgi:hypothetical protein
VQGFGEDMASARSMAVMLWLDCLAAVGDASELRARYVVTCCCSGAKALQNAVQDVLNVTVWLLQ